jgi:hypothetical protein
MTLVEQWEQRRREVQTALAEGRIDPADAARELSHLDYRIKRRPLILKRRHDRTAYRTRKVQQHRAARLALESCSISRARSAE